MLYPRTHSDNINWEIRLNASLMLIYLKDYKTGLVSQFFSTEKELKLSIKMSQLIG